MAKHRVAILTMGFIVALSVGYTTPVYADEIIDNDINENINKTINIEVNTGITSNRNIEESYDIDFTQMTKSEILSYINFLENYKERHKYNDFLRLHSDININMPEFVAMDLYKQAIEVLEDENYLYPYSDEDLKMMAYAIYREHGDSNSSDEVQKLVGCVILNRVNNGGIGGRLEDPSVADIINEAGQYPYKTWEANFSVIPQRCYDNAKAVLEHEYEIPENVLFQAAFKQGTGVYKVIDNPTFGNKTYFCYGVLAN